MMAPDCIADELVRIQVNAQILSSLVGFGPERIEEFFFKIAARDLEIREALGAEAAATELELRVAHAKKRPHALLAECSADAIRALDSRLQAQVTVALLLRPSPIRGIPAPPLQSPPQGL